MLLPLGAARGADPDAPEWKVPGVTRVAVELPVVLHAEKDGPLPAGERFVATLSAEGTLHHGLASRYAAGMGNAGFGPLALTDGRTTLETLAAFQAGGETWKVWSQALDEAVVSNQRKDTTWCLLRGSWDPIGPWGPTGGRIYSTALLAMALETPTRYARPFGR